MSVAVYVIVWFGNNNSFFNASSTKSRATLSTKSATKQKCKYAHKSFSCMRTLAHSHNRPTSPSINQSTVHSFINLFSFAILHEPDFSVSISVPILLTNSLAHSKLPSFTSVNPFLLVHTLSLVTGYSQHA